MGQQAALDGTVSDDGLPAGVMVTTTWAKSAGPGTVTFADAGRVDTNAGFSAAGTYTLVAQISGTGTESMIVSGPAADRSHGHALDSEPVPRPVKRQKRHVSVRGTAT